MNFRLILALVSALALLSLSFLCARNHPTRIQQDLLGRAAAALGAGRGRRHPASPISLPVCVGGFAERCHATS